MYFCMKSFKRRVVVLSKILLLRFCHFSKARFLDFLPSAAGFSDEQWVEGKSIDILVTSFGSGSASDFKSSLHPISLAK